jgi:hypothetical protein
VNNNIFELSVQVLGLYVLEERDARLRETNWSSKYGGFADGLVTLPRNTKYS